MVHEAEVAAQQGELAPGAEPAQVAFELGSILAGTKLVSVLHDDHAVIERARVAVRSRLILD